MLATIDRATEMRQAETDGLQAQELLELALISRNKEAIRIALAALEDARRRWVDAKDHSELASA
jgi:hypothetical protein